MKTLSGGVTAPIGFRAAGVYSGIKKKKKQQLDLALLVSDREGPVAGVFTTNQVVAAPVILDRLHLKRGIGRAFLINSGNANACTGPQGMQVAKEMASLAATALDCAPHTVFVGSTGVIGQPLPIECIRKALPALAARLTRRGGTEAASAIMTTDLKPKQVAVRAQLGGKMVTVGGMAKGSGMIHPNMATMLGYLTTDAAIGQRALQAALRQAVDQSFNCITVDGDMSTNTGALSKVRVVITHAGTTLIDFRVSQFYKNTCCTTIADQFRRRKMCFGWNSSWTITVTNTNANIADTFINGVFSYIRGYPDPIKGIIC